MINILLRPCAGASGFKVTPDHNFALMLKEVSEALSSLGFKERVCVENRILIMECDGMEFTIYPSGRFLIKPEDDGGMVEQERAKKEAERILQVFREMDTEKHGSSSIHNV